MSEAPEFADLRQLLQENLEAFTHTLNSCFEQEWSVTPQQPDPWSTNHPVLSQLATAGLIVAFCPVDDAGYLVAIPESLPLPDWYRSPDETQSSRLQTLAVEWSYQVLPEDFQGTDAAAVQAHDLATSVSWSTPLDKAEVLEIQVSAAGEESPAGSMWLIGPVETPPSAHEVEERWDDVDDGHYEDHEDDFDDMSQQSSGPSDDARAIVERARRLMNLNVKVSVRLAEMKVELSTLINLCPGTLLVFPKSCDDLLDLYVNNRLYAQGEAVKIGEKFGLKVNEIGTVKKRKSGVFTL